jgi:hypothetical protein
MGWNGPGPFKIVNNTLAGAGENIMFGGSDPGIPNLIPSDIEVRRNYIVTPASWKGKWTRKNLFETKNAARVLIEGNVMDGSWADGQVGYAVLFKSANQAGYCTWCQSTDITFRYNHVRNVGAGFQLTGKEGSSPYPVGKLLDRVLIEHNIIENVNTGPYGGDGRLMILQANLSNLTVRSNTMTSSSNNSFLYLTPGAATNVSYTGNVVARGQYGLFGEKAGEGSIALKNISGTVDVSNLVVIGPNRTGYPTGTQFVSSAGQAIGSSGANTASVASATAGVEIP